MFKLDIPLPPKEQAAIDARRGREQARNARISDPRTLRMGQDTGYIVHQVHTPKLRSRATDAHAAHYGVPAATQC